MIYRKQIAVLVFLAFCLTPFSLSAVEIKGLFKANVVVHSQDKGERQLAVAEGLSEVFVRVSGSTEVLQAAAVLEALKKPDRYLIAYSYREIDAEQRSQADAGPNYELSLSFEEATIKGVLKSGGLPVWGAGRPEMMVWWLLGGASEQEIINAESVPEFANLISERAMMRGIPVLFPLLDLQDSAYIAPLDISGFFIDKVSVASQRYGSDIILLGRTDIVAEGASSQWVLIAGDEVFWSDKFNGDALELLSSAVDFAAEKLAFRYAVSSQHDSNKHISLVVHGVSNVSEFMLLEGYLQHLEVVTAINLAMIENETVSFEVLLASDQDQFDQVLKLGRKLVRFSAGPGEKESGLLYEYQWTNY
ncbi:MAG: DUF2066 domain-containing protein [Gammaproteobacteria bacterium]|nr:DUF2066 domain-containing protein [Gammaproteobacteria bacterium]